MNRLFKNWDVFRWIRLITGGASVAYGIYTNDQMFILFGILLAFMAIINWSCCAAGGCGTSNNTKPKYQDIIKTYNPNEKK